MSDELVKEFWNGAWFTLAIAMTFVLVAIALDKVRDYRSMSLAYRDIVVQVCLAMMVFTVASGIRAGYLWSLYHCSHFGDADCKDVTDYEWIVTVAGALAYLGGVCMVRVLSPSNWLPWTWLAVAVVAILFPIAFHYGTAYLWPVQI